MNRLVASVWTIRIGKTLPPERFYWDARAANVGLDKNCGCFISKKTYLAKDEAKADWEYFAKINSFLYWKFEK